MNRKIIVYGNSDKSDKGFPTASNFNSYITEGVYLKEDGRYRFTQTKAADVIVLSRDGVLHGHFEIDDKVPPNDHDRSEYPPVKMVYLVRSSVLYNTPVPMSQVGISGIQFGRYISEDKLREIEAAANGTTQFFAPSIANDRLRVLGEIEQRRGQAAFRDALIASFKGRCAVTGCDAVDALEAAHIDAYSVSYSNDPSNGVLLRCDIHTLFDLNLLGIDPATLTIKLGDRLLKTCYANLDGTCVSLPITPDLHKSLAKRWAQFAESQKEPN